MEYQKTILTQKQGGEILGVIWAVFVEPQHMHLPKLSCFFSIFMIASIKFAVVKNCAHIFYFHIYFILNVDQDLQFNSSVWKQKLPTIFLFSECLNISWKTYLSTSSIFWLHPNPIRCNWLRKWGEESLQKHAWTHFPFSCSIM